MASVMIDLCFEDDTVAEKMAYLISATPGVRWRQVSELDATETGPIELIGSPDKLSKLVLDICGGDPVDAKPFLDKIDAQKEVVNPLTGIRQLKQTDTSLDLIYERVIEGELRRFRYHYHYMKDPQEYLVSIMVLKLVPSSDGELWSFRTVERHWMGGAGEPHPKTLERLMTRLAMVSNRY